MNVHSKAIKRISVFIEITVLLFRYLFGVHSELYLALSREELLLLFELLEQRKAIPHIGCIV